MLSPIRIRRLDSGVSPDRGLLDTSAVVGIEGIDRKRLPIEIAISALTLADRWALPFLRAGRQTIVFGRSRTAVELLLTGLREALREGAGPRSRVRGYRGGYLPTERRAIERGLRDGEVLGVVSTNALELGVDIGRLDAAILAGYPGFTDWGRDTMVSLPGLLLSTGKLFEARRVLEGFLLHLDGGLVPNRFPDDSGPAEYNTVDATLWMFQAVHAFLSAGGAHSFLADVFYPAARQVVEAHLRGTHHDIHVDPKDGLLVAGGPGSNLTWMDARVDGQPVTPRHGKPVEVNALWYNALRLMERWAGQLGDAPAAARYTALGQQAANAFERLFWNPKKDCLYDVLLPEGPDGRVRPNQLLALSLPFPLLGEARRMAVLSKVESELLTPVGLRTLARGEPGYQPSYRGGPAQRDAAYHQGLVWPWLLGPFVDSYLSLYGSTPETRSHCGNLLRGLEARLFDNGCLGSVSECFEAEPPFRPVAAPAQAWSVAELLRARARLQVLSS